MQTYLFTYAERVSNISGSSSSRELFYKIELFELIYQLKLDLVLENHVPFGSELKVRVAEPYPIPKFKNNRLNRLLRCCKYSKSGVYR